MATAVIHLTERFVRIGQVEVKKNMFNLVSYGYDNVDPAFFSGGTDTLVQKYATTLKKLYTSLKINATSIRLVMPDAYTYSQIIEVPKLKEKELLAAIRYQADEFIPLPIEETNLDLEILEEYPETKKALVLIVASPKKMVAQIEKVLEIADIEAEVLENEMAPIGRLLSEIVKPKATGMLIINFGYFETSLYILNERSIIILSRSIKVGLYHFVKDLVVNLNIDEQHATEMLKSVGLHANASYNIETIVSPMLSELSTNIQKLLLLSQSKFAITCATAHMVNFDSHISGISEFLTTTLGLPVQPFPLQTFIQQSPLSQSVSHDVTALTALLGASL